MIPIEISELHLSDEARKFLPPNPPPARMMAAKGLAPLGPVDLVSVQIVLTADEDEKIAAAARESVGGLPESLLKAAAESSLDPAILDYLARCTLTPAAKEALILNKAVGDDTLIHIAATETDDRVLDILSGNQARMLKNVSIAEALLDNTKLSYNTKKRLEEFFINDFTANILASDAEAGVTEDDLSKDFAAALATIPAEGEGIEQLTADVFAKEFLEEKQDKDAPAKSKAAPVEEEPQGGVYKQILGMKISQKIKLALKGNKEARSILIKDSNKLVATGVLKNPRITDGEVIMIASSKSSIEDLLRLISVNPAWMRNYPIKVALVNNAKCPIPVAQKLINQLHDHDLKSISKSRGVSGVVKQQAIRILKQRQKR